jgi:peroxiredoxin
MSATAWIVAGVLSGCLIGLAAFSLQLLTQNGRLLIRAERLEASLADAGIALSNALEGVAVGTELSFVLPDLDGQTVSLDHYAGRRVMLVNWSPDCSFCDMVAADLADMQAGMRAKQVELLLVSRGDPQANRELVEHHGLSATVLLADDAAPLECFARAGTPAAYLLDERGAVATELVVGADKVDELARAVADKRRRLSSEKPLSESKLERSGIKTGTQAPSFTLPDLDGGELSLDDHAGERRLVVFSDPDCGPCDELAPGLSRMHEEAHNRGLAILMVSRGDPGANREKRERYGIRFPVGLQRSWEISRKYGIFSTPVAFLVDEQGRVARDVAIGPEAIVALLADELAGRKEEPIEA